MDNPTAAAKDDIVLFSRDDALYYARQGRRFVRELLGARSFYRPSRADRDPNRPGVKREFRAYASSGREFNALYKNLERAVCVSEYNV